MSVPGGSGRDDPSLRGLSDAAAKRLLARASELDAERRAVAAVDELRAAALEAGISGQAFDAALAEMGRSDEVAPTTPPPVPAPRSVVRRASFWLGTVAALAVIAALTVIPRLVVSSGPVNPLFERSLVLECLEPTAAADLARPVLNQPEDEILARGAPSRSIVLRGARERVERAAALIRQQEAASPSCQASTPPR